MARSPKQSTRRPATKFPHLVKKLQKANTTAQVECRRIRTGRGWFMPEPMGPSRARTTREVGGHG